MRSAREMAHDVSPCTGPGTYVRWGDNGTEEFFEANHSSKCDELTAAIEARDAEHEAELTLHVEGAQDALQVTVDELNEARSRTPVVPACDRCRQLAGSNWECSEHPGNARTSPPPAPGVRLRDDADLDWARKAIAAMAQRWELTPEWHTSWPCGMPFHDGRVYVTTRELHAAAVLTRAGHLAALPSRTPVVPRDPVQAVLATPCERHDAAKGYGCAWGKGPLVDANLTFCPERIRAALAASQPPTGGTGR